VQLKELSSDNLFVKKLETVAEEIKEDESWRDAYMQSLLKERDIFKRGVEQERIKVVKNLLSMGLSVEDVSEGMELSLKEVAELKRKLDQPI